MKKLLLLGAVLLLSFVSCSEKLSKGEEYATSEKALTQVVLDSHQYKNILEIETEAELQDILTEMNARISFSHGDEPVLVVEDETFDPDKPEIIRRLSENLVIYDSGQTEFEFAEEGFDFSNPSKNSRSPKKWPKEFYEKVEGLFPTLNEQFIDFLVKDIDFSKYIMLERCQKNPERSGPDIDVYQVLYKMEIPYINWHRYYGYDLYFTRDGEIRFELARDGESLLDIYEH